MSQQDTRYTLAANREGVTAAPWPGVPYALTIAEAAARLGVSRAYAYQLASDGTLPTVRLGRRILVPVEAMARLLTVA